MVGTPASGFSSAYGQINQGINRRGTCRRSTLARSRGARFRPCLARETDQGFLYPPGIVPMVPDFLGCFDHPIKRLILYQQELFPHPGWESLEKSSPHQRFSWPKFTRIIAHTLVNHGLDREIEVPGGTVVEYVRPQMP